MMCPKVSVIVTHWAMTPYRSETMRKCIDSLIKTAGKLEIIVADNGGNIEDSRWLLDRAEGGKIAIYIRNRHNICWEARNQALKLCTGEHIVMSDNDIEYQDGWWEECLKFLENHTDGKYFATPIRCDKSHDNHKYWFGEKDGWRLNSLAGSNCWMMHKSAWQEIGPFCHHNISGTHWSRRQARLGYVVAVMPEPKAADLGHKQGMDFHHPTYTEEI
jgi:glycosyltransferase involved in cell wall biosynthesis